MAKKELFTVAEAATLIAEVTGGDKFHIAKTISIETRLGKIQFYDSQGRAGDWAQALYGITSDLQEWQILRAIGHPNAKEKPESNALRFSDDPCHFHQMDMGKLLNCLGYHPSIQEKILNLRPLIESEATPALADAFIQTQPQVKPEPQQSNAQHKRWTPELLAEVAAYRSKHGTEKAAARYQVTGTRIRQLLPRDTPKSKGNSVFTRRA